MNIDTSQFTEGGTYILAISGGVDSMVLLEILHEKHAGAYTWVIAHLDHGIRNKSASDANFVAEAAREYGYAVEIGRAQFSIETGEGLLRQARYDFLETVRQKYSAQAIVTAHHQDDVLETMVFNMLRGTNRKGLSSLQSTKNIIRPLLGLPKKELEDYAARTGLKWREDETNTNTKYARNWIRTHIMPRLTPQNRQQLIEIHTDISRVNTEANDLLDALIPQLQVGDSIFSMKRYRFIMLDRSVVHELLAGALHAQSIEVNAKKLTDAWLFAKTAAAGTQRDIGGGFSLYVDSKTVCIR